MSQEQDAQKPLDLESLARVTARLREALVEHAKTPEDLFVLNAVIKRFELTYELSTRSLRRFLLEQDISAAEIRDKSFQGIIRRGDKEGLLLSGWPRWEDFRDARNETAHTYTESKAREVARVAGEFIVEAEYLLKRLERNTASHG